MGHVAAIDLRSGKKLPDTIRKFKETQSTAMPNDTHSVSDGTTIQRGPSADNVFVLDGTHSVSDDTTV